MRTLSKIVLAVAITAGAAGAGSTHAFNGAAPIARGDYAAAEREIVAQRGLFPNDTDLMLNLATVYLRTGRPEAARRVYQAVLAQPDEEVVLRDATSVRTHALASAALGRLPMQVALR